MTVVPPGLRLAAAVTLLWLSLDPLTVRGGVTGALPRYHVTDLGRNFGPSGVSNDGRVIGLLFGENQTDGGLYADGRLSVLPALPGGRSTWPTDINDRGQILGFSTPHPAGPETGTTSTSYPVVHEAGRLRRLRLPGGPEDAYPEAINNRGQVVLGSHLVNPDGRARPLPVGGDVDLNDRGQVVGTVLIGNGNYAHGVLAEPDGRVRELAPPAGGWDEYDSDATGINNRGQVVGTFATYTLGVGVSRGSFLHDAGGWRALAVGEDGGRPNAINDLGQVVGFASAGGDRYFGFVWDGAAAADLNDLLAPGSANWQIRGASDINDAGQIAAYGTNRQGEEHGLLLTPLGGPGGNPTPAVPLPPAVWAGLGTLAGVGLARVGKRRRAAA